MRRTADQLNRIEAALAKLEETVSGQSAVFREETAALRTDLHAMRASADAARSSADAAHAGVLAMLTPGETIVPADPPSAGTSQAAGGGTEGEPDAAVRRARKTLLPKEKM